MTQFTNYAENKLIDKLRGTEPTYPTNWFIALGTAASDSSFTEITGADLPRVSYTRSLANFAGTQGAGTTLASSGTSHTTSNNNVIQFDTAASNRGTATHAGFFDASTAGNCWIWLPLGTSIVINLGDTPSIDAGILQMSLGLSSPGLSDYAANKFIDEIFRAQAYAWPATTYSALYTVAPTKAGGGTEASGGSYARASLASSSAALSGTQSAGSTSASSGTGGRSSNNAALSHPAPTGDWGDIVAHAMKDASTSGNQLFSGTFASPKTVSAGGLAPSFAPNTLAFTLD